MLLLLFWLFCLFSRDEIYVNIEYVLMEICFILKNYYFKFVVFDINGFVVRCVLCGWWVFSNSSKDN